MCHHGINRQFFRFAIEKFFRPIVTSKNELKFIFYLKMLRVAVLGSTAGTDLKAIIEAINSGQLTGIEIVLVISNVASAKILDLARHYKISNIFIDSQNYATRDLYDQKIIECLTSLRVDLVLLIGYMKLISVSLIRCFKNRIMNIHPSLLPAFAGQMDLNIHRAVLERGCKLTGASLIFIDEGPDTGPIISQKSLEIAPEETPESLKARVQIVEQALLIQALEWFRDGRIHVTIDNKVNIK